MNDHPATAAEFFLIFGVFLVAALAWCIWDWWLDNHG